MLKIKRALISVSNKNKLEQLCLLLKEYGVQVTSTGGTAKFIKQYIEDVQDISTVTSFPEILDGRVKTLHPHIHGGILARKEQQKDMAAIEKLNIKPYDLVVINLYPFASSVKQALPFDDMLEQIDIGGSTLLRAAAKNYKSVALISKPDDYELLVQEMCANNGKVSNEFRAKLMAKAFFLSSEYDSRIAEYFKSVLDSNYNQDSSLSQKLPNEKQAAEKIKEQSKSEILAAAYPLNELRYGENPHQRATVYTNEQSPKGLVGAKLLNGKPLSYNNLVDADLALRLVNQLTAPACVIVKHVQPCGAAYDHTDISIAYKRALNADKESAFGGIVAFNRPLNAETAELISKQFTELVIACGIDEAALDILQRKKDLRILDCQLLSNNEYSLKNINGGFLRQDIDNAIPSIESLDWVSKTKSDKVEDMLFAWTIAKYCHSNAIVIAKERSTCGLGVGQTSRVFSVRCALLRAQDNEINLQGAVLASDAFFPFADSVELIASSGISAIIQPGGSKRDTEVIAAADKYNIAMAFTGIRAFYHG